MRLRFIQLSIFVFLIAIVLRLWFWQIIKNDDLTARAEEQRLSTKVVLAPRGEIKYADGSILAGNSPTFNLFAQPKIIEDKDLVAHKLTELLFEPDPTTTDIQKILDDKHTFEEDLLEKLSKDLFWISLKKNLSLPKKLEIDRLNIRGLGFDQNIERFYPEGSSSAHLLGFVGSDAYGDKTGYFGIEGYYNGELKGINGKLVQDRDAQGVPILIGTYKESPAKPGKTLILNVDRTIQNIVETSLKKGLEKYGAKSASAVVLDPQTGNVLALASYPSYDPADVTKYPKENFKNPITVDGYEPGSTFKVLVMAAGINEGVVTPETRCDICAGPVQISGFSIRTWNNQYQPNATMTDVIIHSDNTGMVFVAKKLGIDKMYDYIQKFGFGLQTGIDVQDELSPDIRSKDDWKEIDLATSSFGQGISVTALQVVRAVAAIANGGALMEPHIVKSITDEKGTVEIKPKEVGRPISPETAKVVTEMMVKAVDEGEAKFFKPKGYKIAGKTGTAQIPVAGHYDANKTIASFVGFAPADNPKFIMLVRYDQPTSSIYGAETAAPTFFDISKQLFQYYGIPPSEGN